MATAHKCNIMVIDDTPANLRLLAGLLEKHGYTVRTQFDGMMALAAIEKEHPDLILLDIDMPRMNGFEVCDRIKAAPRLRDIPIIFISALSDVEDKVHAFQRGGVDYVTKPFQFDEVLARVETHLSLSRCQAELEKHNLHLNELVKEQVKEILARKEELLQAQLATILALSKLAEERDDDTGKHIERTRAFCRLLARELAKTKEFDGIIDDQFIENIYQAAPLHDVGKVAIADAILLKPGRLTSEEFDIMKTHTVRGEKTLEAVDLEYPHNVFVQMGIEIASSHHEKWNGSGYPNGISGPQIPLSARIMALADVYDALVSKRSYKDAYSHERSKNIIVDSRGTHFDPAVVDAFLAVEAEFHMILQEMND